MKGRLALAALVGLSIGACRSSLEQECNPGAEGCECSDTGECLGELVCLSNLCVSPDEAETGTETAADDDESTSNEGSSGGDGDADAGDGDAGDGDSGDGDTGDGDTGDGDSGDGDSGDGDSGDGDALPDPDDFEGSELGRAWSVLNPERATVSFDGDRILMDPEPETVWWLGGQSILIYQLVSGNFMVTADITSTTLNEGGPPATGFRLGGLMMRSAEFQNENYVAVLVGGGANAVVAETKNTMNSASTLEEFPWATGAGQFRICRFGSTFRMLGRATSSDSWQQLFDYVREDLPSELQTGLVAYSNVGTPDLRVASDRIEFAPVSGLDDCTN